MRSLWLVLHLLGMALWLGGGISAMTLGIALRRGGPVELAQLGGLQARLHRMVILPGVLLVVLSGLLLTLQLYGGATSVGGFPVSLMVMQGAGLLGAGIVLAVGMPAVARLARLDPAGAQAPLFQSLSRRASLAGSLSGLLAAAALIAGAVGR